MSFFKNKILFGWLLLDFANSILLVNGGIYFSRWLIDDLGTPSYVYNLIIICSTLLIIIGSISIGKVIEKIGAFKPLTFFILLMSIAALLLSAMSIWGGIEINIIIISLLFLTILTAYQASIVCYNTYLVFPPLNENIKVNSSKSSIANWLGSVVGIFLTMGFVSGKISPDFAGNKAVFLPASIVTVVLSLTGLFILSKYAKNSIPKVTIQKSIWRLFKNKKYTFYMIGVILLIDTIFTIQLNLSQVMSTVHNVSSQAIAPLFGLILLGAATGGILAMKLNFSVAKRVLIVSAIFSLLIISIVALPFTFALFAILFFLSGVSVGVLEPTLREGYTQFVSKTDAGQTFGMYNVIGRASIIIGPIILSLLLWMFTSDATAYNYAFIILSLFSITGGLLIYKSYKTN